MIRSLALAIALLTILTALPAAAAPRFQAPAAQPGAANPDFMGMVIRDPWYDFGTLPGAPGQPNQLFQDAMGARLAGMGVRWVRLDFHIPIDYNGSNEQVDAEIAKNDYFINEVAPRNGLKVLALLSFDVVQGINPRELNTGAAIPNDRFGGGVNAYIHAWLTRALQIADRYRDKIAAYEVLNEQNRLPQYAGSGASGDAIAPEVTGRLLTKFYRWCKNIDPINENHGCGGAKIILGGIHPRGTGGSTITMTDAQYLQAIYDDKNSFGAYKTAHGAYPVDGIGYHPYPEEIRLSPNDAYVNKGIARMRLVLNGVDPGQQFWITEVGYNVGFDPDGAKNPRPAQTEAGQAALMRDVYTSLAQRLLPNSSQPEVANVFWFKYEDFPPATGPNAQQWGVVRIPFSDGGSVNGATCPGGACYETFGQPSQLRQSYFAYRDLAGLPPINFAYRIYAPLIRR
jgi:hypothetical protein